MMELLRACQELVVGLLTTTWGLVTLVLTFCGDVLLHLHTTAPRLEGLLVGVALVWMMQRRDKHAVLRVLSSPLKLVLDILDLAWDQGVEVVSDAWGTVYGWVTGTLGWCKAKLVSVYNTVMGLLGKIKDKLSN